MANDMATDDTIHASALDWAVRTGDPAFADWDSFTQWLEADPAHALAYDRVSAAVMDATDLAASAGPANDDTAVEEPIRPNRRRWLAGMVAAGIAVVAGLWTLQGQQRALYTVETALGQTRSIAIDPGTRVELAGGTLIELDHKDARYARLDRGQALFTVRHDPAHPFEVAVGETRLIDVGTVFDVRHDAQGLSVAVSEGAVQVDPDGVDVRVSPGEMLRRSAGSDAYTLSRVAPDQIGEWREGRLTFDAANLAEVADRLTRATGISYVASDGAGTQVSGSILTASLRRNPAAIGPLLGVAVRAEGDRWVIGSR